MAVRIVKALLVIVTLLLIVYLYAPARPASHLRDAGERGALPDFSLHDVNGQDWNLEAHRGQVVLVNFWATWCPPCREETPALVRLANQYRGRVAIVGIASDDQPEAVRKFIAEYRVPYPVLIPPADFQLAARVEDLPTTFLVDRTGRIARTYVGRVDEEVFRADIERLLAETGA